MVSKRLVAVNTDGRRRRLLRSRLPSLGKAGSAQAAREAALGMNIFPSRRLIRRRGEAKDE